MSASVRWRTAGLLTAALLLSGLVLGDLPETDNSVDILLGDRSAPARSYREFRETFGADDLTLVVLSGGGWSDLVRHVEAVHALLEGHPELTLVVTASTAFGSSLAALADPALGGPADLPGVRQALDGPLNQELGLLSLDPPRARLLAASAPGRPPAGLLEDLELARRAAEADGVELRVAGTAVLNAAIDRAGEHIATRALPAVIGLAALLLLLAIRRLRSVLFVLAAVPLVVFGIDAIYGALGGTNNVLVAIHRPVAFVLMLASGIHILEAWGREDTPDPYSAARTKSRAIQLALFTTAVGFGSLAVSPLPPIRDFGLLTAACLLAAIPVVLGLLPIGLSRARPPRLRSGWSERVTRAAVGFGARHRVPVRVGGLAIVAAGVAAAAAVPVDTHAIRYFGEDTRIRKDHEAIEASGLGLQTLEVLLAFETPWRPQPRPIEQLDAFASAVRELDHVTTRFDPALLLLEAGYRVAGRPVPPDPLSLEEVWSDRSRWRRATVAKDGRLVRAAFLVETVDAEALDRLERRIRELVDEHFAHRAPAVTVTGSYRLLLEAQRSLLRTLLFSLVLTGVVMQLILVVALGPYLGIRAMLPNSIPVATTFIAMWAAGIPLDLGTCMVASLSLGIAVDDTLHFALAYDGEDLDRAARKSGRAILLSSLVMSLGFLALAPSEFRPAAAFGLLSATALGAAVIGDLVVFPALLAKPRHRP